METDRDMIRGMVARAPYAAVVGLLCDVAPDAPWDEADETDTRAYAADIAWQGYADGIIDSVTLAEILGVPR